MMTFSSKSRGSESNRYDRQLCEGQFACRFLFVCIIVVIQAMQSTT